jgi:hypothetical protein
VQRINIRYRILCSATNLGFVVEVVWSAMNLKLNAEIELFANSLPKLCCLQRI